MTACYVILIKVSFICILAPYCIQFSISHCALCLTIPIFCLQFVPNHAIETISFFRYNLGPYEQ